MKIGIDVDGVFKEVAKEHGLYREVADQHRGNSQQHQGQSDHPRRLMRGMVVAMSMVCFRVLIKAFFAVKDQKIHSK